MLNTTPLRVTLLQVALFSAAQYRRDFNSPTGKTVSMVSDQVSEMSHIDPTTLEAPTNVEREITEWSKDFAEDLPWSYLNGLYNKESLYFKIENVPGEDDQVVFYLNQPQYLSLGHLLDFEKYCQRMVEDELYPWEKTVNPLEGDYTPDHDNWASWELIGDIVQMLELYLIYHGYMHDATYSQSLRWFGQKHGNLIPNPPAPVKVSAVVLYAVPVGFEVTAGMPEDEIHAKLLETAQEILSPDYPNTATITLTEYKHDDA